MQQYLELLGYIKAFGTKKPGARPGMPGSLSLFGHQFRHDLSKGFPLLTTKKVFWKGVVHELIWFLKGDTNIKYLLDNGINIWNEDAYNFFKKRFPDSTATLEEFLERVKGGYTRKGSDFKYGDCGFQYGRVWRDWEVDEEDHRGTIDQIQNLINSLKNTPESRRHIVTAIDPANDTNLALYWCHAMFQFNCRSIEFSERKAMFGIHTSTFADCEITEAMDQNGVPKYYLDCQLYQRSADVVLGVPFNIASYALLTHIIAKLVNMIPGEFIHTFGDVHIYDNHMEAVEEQLSRTPTELPKLHWNTEASFENSPSLEDFLAGFEFEDLFLEGYNPQPAIKAKLSTGLQ